MRNKDLYSVSSNSSPKQEMIITQSIGLKYKGKTLTYIHNINLKILKSIYTRSIWWYGILTGISAANMVARKIISILRKLRFWDNSDFSSPVIKYFTA